jgi:glycosyltransferase involved in cell wall biosynthesis
LDFTNCKIGYWPNHPDLLMPGDRRRFVFYAHERKINFELADANKEFDVVYLTSNCNCSRWIKYKQQHPQTKIIFELIDSYLLEDLKISNLFRGMTRFIKKREDQLYIDYRKAFLKMIQTADAVVCSTPIQKEEILKHNQNVHLSLDYFSNDINHFKTDYSVSSKLKLVWEGQAYTVHNLLAVNKAFKELRDEVELHIVTDPVIKMPLKFLNKKTDVTLSQLNCDYKIHNWEKQSFSKLIADADLSIIPINNKDKLMWNKPENKLLLLWEIGVPVLTSPTPAYKRVVTKAGINGLCASTEQWVKKMREFKAASTEKRKGMAQLATVYLNENHSKNKILQNWDTIFASVLELTNAQNKTHSNFQS